MGLVLIMENLLFGIIYKEINNMNFQQKAIEVMKEMFPYILNTKYNNIELKIVTSEHNESFLCNATMEVSFNDDSSIIMLNIHPDIEKYGTIEYQNRYKHSISFMRTYDIRVGKYEIFIYELLTVLALIDTAIIMHTHGRRNEIDKLLSPVQFLFSDAENKNFRDNRNLSLGGVLSYKYNRRHTFAMQNFKKVYDQVKEYIPEGDK
jgi:hypothetical protein